MIRNSIRFFMVLVIIAACVGCETTIDVENLPARVTGMGPIDGQVRVESGGRDTLSQVRVHYMLRDFEGDDARIFVEVCEADNLDQDGACGTAVEGLFSDGTSRIPTAPFDTDIPHQFRWDVGCGRIIAGDRVSVDFALDYVFRFIVSGSDEDPVTSEQFNLVDDLGFDPDAELDCNP